MPRKSLVHYIAPSAISITPNCNESANDLAVSLIRGAKIKVFSPAVGLETEDGYFQEWTLYGRNRRLADSAGNDGHRYTIYARLPKANKDGGYLVFAQMTKDEDGEWVDKYWHVTSKGYSRRDDNRLDEDFDPDDPPQTDEDEKKMQKNNWWFRLGEVSEPSGGQRTVTLDTGILGTDQFNTEWNLVQEGLHVDLTCRLVEPYEPIPDLDPDDEEPEPEGEDAGPTPYVPWGYWLFMKAELAGVSDDEVVEVKKWEITRSTGAGSIDWMEEDDPRREQFKKKGRIDLKHTRGEEGTDDFEAAVSLVFTVTAWGTKHERTDKDDEEEEQEPVVVVQDGDEGDEGEEGDDGEILAMATITIMSETNEQYALQLSETIVNYDEENGFSPEKVFVHVRSTDQRTAVTDITTEQMTTARLSVEYALANDLDKWIPLTFEDSDPTDPDDPDYPNLVARAFIGGGGDDSVFYEGENIIVRLIETLQQKGEDGQTSTVIKELSRKTILNYYNLGTKYVTVGFFKKLFAVHHIGDDGNDEIIETNRKIKDEDEDPTVNIEAKRGFWSPSYVSALGQGSGEGGGGAALEWPLQDINVADMPRNPKAGDTIVWDGTTFSWGKSGADMKKLTLYNGPTTLAEYDGKQAVQLDLAQHFVKTQGSSTITGDLLLIRTPGTAIGNTSVLTKQDAEKLFDERYVRVNWFKKLFEAREQDGTEVKPNEDGPINNLKVLVGTWTQQYLSALGIGSDGGSGGVWYLSQLEDVDHSKDPQNNDTLIWDGSQWTFGTAGLDTNELNRILQGKTLTIKDGTTSLGSWNPSQPGEIDISAILTGKKWWGRSLEGGQVKGSLDDVGNITPDNAGPYSIGSDQKRFGAIYVNEIYIGDAKISWDDINRGVHLSKAMYSDEWVSALGTGSSGGPGGLDLELMWEALGGTYQTNEQISASHLSNVTNPLRVYVDNELVCTYDGKDAKRLYLQSGGSIGDGVQLWGNPFDGTNSVNGNITFGASGSNVAGLMYFHTDTDKQVRITTLSNTAVASYTRSGQTYRPRVYVDGNVGVTGEVWMDRLTFAGSNANGGYIDFHYSGDNSDQYTTQIIESALGVLTVQRRSGATGLVVGGSANADYIQIGGAKITWDEAKQGLHIDKGVWSDSFVSALGTGSEGGPGGIDLEDMWTALGGTYLTREQISADHLANVTKTLTLKVGSTTYTYNGTRDVGPIDLSAGGADISEYSWWGAGMTGKKREGNMSNVGDITFQATGKNIGGVAFFDTEHTRLGIGAAPGAYALDVSGDVKANKFYFNSNVYLECDSNGDVHLHGAGFWADDFVSTLGTGSAGGGGTPLDTLLMSLNGAANVQNPDGVSNKVLVCTDGNWSWQTYNAGGGGGTTVSANLWGNHFDGTNDINGNITMVGFITGCTAIDNIAYFDTTTNAKKLGINQSSPSYTLDVTGNVRATQVSWFPALELFGDGSATYVDFRTGISSSDYNIRLKDTTGSGSAVSGANELSIQSTNGNKKTGLVVGRGVPGDYIKIGGATIYWDNDKQGLHIDKGVWSDSYVSALGTGSDGGSGTDFGFNLSGTRLEVGTQTSIDLGNTFASWAKLTTQDRTKIIHNSHINLNTLTINVNGTAYTYNGQDTQTVVINTGGGGTTGGLTWTDLQTANGHNIGGTSGRLDNLYGTNANLSGKVEIGSATTGDYKLFVDGKARITTGLGINTFLSNYQFSVDGKSHFDGLTELINSGTGNTLEVDGNSVFDGNITATKFIVDETSTGFLKANGDVDTNTYATTDTKNTAGNSQSNSTLLYLIAGSSSTSQNSSTQTYTNSKCYIGTDNCLYSNGSKVLTSALALGDLSNVTISSPTAGQALVYRNGGWLNETISASYTLPAASSSVLGGIKTGYTTSGKNYKVQLDSSNNAYVNVPWSDTDNDTKNTVGINAIGAYASEIYLVGTKVTPNSTTGSDFATGFESSTCYIKGNCLYSNGSKVLTSALALGDLSNVTISSPTAGQALVYRNGGWLNETISASYTLPAASSSVLGGIKTGYTTSGKNYKVQLDSSNNAYVNVPWSDTDNDTKNTVGINAIGAYASEIYLVGTKVTPNSTTGSDFATGFESSTCYIKGNCLYSNGSKVLTEALTGFLPLTGGTLSAGSNADPLALNATRGYTVTRYLMSNTFKWSVGCDADKFYWYSGGTSSIVLSILNNGNVGIGTTSPGDYKLYVNGKGYFNGDLYSNGSKVLTSGSVVTLADTQTISGKKTFSSGAKFQYLCIECDNSGSPTGRTGEINRYGGDVHIQWNTAYNTTMCVGGGNVGIGTANPGNYKLYVNGTGYFSGNVYSNSLPVLTSGTGVTLAGDQAVDGEKTFKKSILTSNSNTSLGSSSIPWGTVYCKNATIDKGTISITGTMSTMYIKEGHIYDPNNTIDIQAGGDTGTSNPRNVTICHGGGNVGIGASVNSDCKLYVNGKVGIKGYVVNSTYDYKLYVSGNSLFAGYVFIGSNADVRLERYVPASGRVYLNVNATSGITTNATATSSDIRKKNVVSMVENVSVEDIARAPIFNFTWKAGYGDSQLHLGTSAQYWQPILRNGVMDFGKDGLSMDYGSIALSAAVITARTVLTHEERIAALEAENKRLRAEINELKLAA